MIRSVPRHSTVLAACLAMACAGGGSDDDKRQRRGCNPPDPTTISLSTNVQPIFDASCALAGCHAGGAPVLNLDLTAGQSHGETVGVASEQRPSLDLIKAGDPDESYLIRKIEGGPELSGGLMPLGCPGSPQNGAVCLGSNEIAAIRTWITECATDN